MSRLLKLLNYVKAQADQSMLTPSQRLAFDRVLKQWRFPDVINLCGPSGSGKTFLGWTIANYTSASFYVTPKHLKQDLPLFTRGIVVDNTPTESKGLRKVLSEIQLRQIENALLITRAPNRLGLATVRLDKPAKTDIEQLYQNFSRLQFHPDQPLDQGDCWQVIHSVL